MAQARPQFDPAPLRTAAAAVAALGVLTPATQKAFVTAWADAQSFRFTALAVLASNVVTEAATYAASPAALLDSQAVWAVGAGVDVLITESRCAVSPGFDPAPLANALAAYNGLGLDSLPAWQLVAAELMILFEYMLPDFSQFQPPRDETGV